MVQGRLISADSILTLQREKKFIKDDNYVDKSILNELTDVHLEWAEITRIENLDVVPACSSLYLQGNSLSKIENLSPLASQLVFLALQHNQIERVESLLQCSQLQFLDMSHNKIETLDYQELPNTLAIVLFVGNACTNQNNYRQEIIARCPDMHEIDNLAVDQVHQNTEQRLSEQVKQQHEVEAFASGSLKIMAAMNDVKSDGMDSFSFLTENVHIKETPGFDEAVFHARAGREERAKEAELEAQEALLVEE